jgi:uncharacterized protein YndB with AHSA1/START domain
MSDLMVELERVRREVGTAAVPAGQGHLVELRRVCEAAVEDVWDACTVPDRVGRWFLPLTGELRLGGRYQLEGNAGGEITECQPPRRLALTWEFGDDVGLVTLDLAPLDDGRTELRLRHAVPDDEHWARYGPGAIGVGWDVTLLGLAAFVRTGEPAFGAEALGSEPMLGLMRRSALEWGAAHAASGASPTTTQEAAAQTSAAYAPDPHGTPGDGHGAAG